MRTQGALGRGHSPWAGTHHTEGLALLERAVTWGLRRVLLTCEQSPPAVSPRSPHGPDKPSKQPPGLLAPNAPSRREPSVFGDAPS